MLPVSKDTLLRVVRRRSRPPVDPLRIIGIDDWAWRRNHRYASIVCNLERRRVVTLLPTVSPRLPKPGSLRIPQSGSWPVTAVEDIAKLRQRPCRTRYRSQIAGI